MKMQLEWEFVKKLEGPGKLAGYKNIWHALRIRHGIYVPRNFVAQIMKEIDPDGVSERKSRRLRRQIFISRGANVSWHIDGMLYPVITEQNGTL